MDSKRRRSFWTPAVLAAGMLLTVSGAAWAQGMPGSGSGFPPPEMQAKMAAWQTFRDSHRHVRQVERLLSGLSQLDGNSATKLTRAQAKAILPVLQTWHTKPVMTDAQAAQVSKKLMASLTVAQTRKLTAMAAARRGPGTSGGPGGPGGPPPPEGDFGPPPGGGPGGPSGSGGFGPPPGGGGFGGPGGPPPGMGSGGGPPGPPPDGGSSGPGGPGGPPDMASFPSPREYNPINPETLPFERMRPAAKKMVDGLIARLKSRTTG